jgi:ribosomal protein L37AE/L43A
MSAQDLRFCTIGRHDVERGEDGLWRCRRCENVFLMGPPAPFSPGGRTSNIHAPKPGILPDAS